MNIKELKAYIQDLPDDMEIARWDDDNIAYRKIDEVSIEDWFMNIEMVEWNKYLTFN